MVLAIEEFLRNDILCVGIQIYTKKQKERLHINVCSDVLGTIKLPLKLIGKYKNPGVFKKH